ncbi:MAG: Tex family protein [Bacilli bacterium]
MNINKIISEELNLEEKKIIAAVTLLDNGDTVPFIARYRKEVTGSLTDDDLRELEKKLNYYRSVNERAVTILKSLEEQGVLTDVLKSEIEAARKLTELEDIYRPFKPKKKTRASIAIEKGLKPLALTIFNGEVIENFDEYVSSFINEEKKVLTAKDALSGAKDIIAEMISDDPEYRRYIKGLILRTGMISSIELIKDEKDTFANYKDYREQISKIPNFRILALSRGETLKCLKVKLEYDVDTIARFIEINIVKNDVYTTIIKEVIADSLKRLILPSVETEIRSDLFTRAEDASIIVFEQNLKQLLLYPPLRNKVVLGFDPGFRTGCKICVVNEHGDMQMVDVVYVTSASENQIQLGIAKVAEAIIKYNVSYIALGNGTASRESEEVLSKMIKDYKLNVKISMVNESGASVYSASELAQKEYPDLTVEKRSAISLARRLQDPLSELVKIDPKAIGVGQYQHDMNQGKLDFALKEVIGVCVNNVGVNINNASKEILKYISGISESLANNIIDYRVEHVAFKSRSELQKVPKLGPKAFQLCAGFLRIPESKNPFDNTGVHPESYKLAESILELISMKPIDILVKENQDKIANLYDSDFFKKNLKEYNETIDDILRELIKPGHDIRDEAEIVELSSEAKDIKSLKVGMILTGVVHNITDFGAFVDINVHQDGLVHISQITNKFIRHPNEVLQINDVVKVKVISVDVEKKKIGLSIKQVEK